MGATGGYEYVDSHYENRNLWRVSLVLRNRSRGGAVEVRLLNFQRTASILRFRKNRLLEVISMSGYEAVKALADEKPDWLKVALAAYRVAEGRDYFPGASVLDEAGGWLPSLRTLARFGVIEKAWTSRRGHRAYWRMPDREGVARGLAERGLM